MRAKAKDEGFRTDWSYDDVYSLIKDVRAMSSAKDLDATNLLEYLTEREKTFGLRYFARTDGDRLNMLFFELEGGFDDWACGGTENVLMFDPTWGTNKYGVKLACFTTVAPTGRTVVNSCVLIRNEDTPTFEWCFRCFAEVFRTPPVACFTDGDTAMARALRLAIPARCYQWASMSSFRPPISVNSSSERFSCCRRRCLRAGLGPRRRPVARNFALSVRVSHLEELCQEAEAPVCSQR